MRANKTITLLIVALLSGLAGLATFMGWDRTNETYRRYERIETGMTREQAEAVLGRPVVGVGTVPHVHAHSKRPDPPPGWTGVVWGDLLLHWPADSCDVYVGLSDGRVTGKFYSEPSL